MKNGTFSLGKDKIIARLVYDRGYNVTPEQRELVGKIIKKYASVKEDINVLINKVCAELDAAGVEKENTMEFEGSYYRDSKLEECLNIAKTDSKVKDPDKLINWLRVLNKDLMSSGMNLDLNTAKKYIEEYNDLKKQAELKNKIETYNDRRGR